MQPAGKCEIPDRHINVLNRGVRLAKNDFGSVYKIVRFWFFLVRLGLHSSVDVIFDLRLCGMMLEMTYFCAELVQLIVNQSDSELEVQRYGMKKNTLTVDPIMPQDELWMRQREKPSPKPPKSFFWKLNCGNRVFGFWILRSFWFGF